MKPTQPASITICGRSSAERESAPLSVIVKSGSANLGALMCQGLHSRSFRRTQGLAVLPRSGLATIFNTFKQRSGPAPPLSRKPLWRGEKLLYSADAVYTSFVTLSADRSSSRCSVFTRPDPTVVRRCLLAASLLLVLPAYPVAAQTRSSEELVYFNGGVSLAASLLLPEGAGPFPGIVIVHGSGSSERSNPWTSAYADALVERGVAVLHPDKRGSGASGGTWRAATFDDLALDASAALAALVAHSAVDSNRVGFIGFSQGGHVVPLATALSQQADFVVNVSGSVVPMIEQIGDEIRMMGEREGLTHDDLETVMTIHDLAVRYISAGEGWDAYAAALANAKSGQLSDSDVIGGFPTDPSSPTWEFLRLISPFDPLPYWREISVPALFLYGGQDENVDVYKSVDVIEEVLTPSGLAYSLLLFRNNGHALYREDAMDFIARWVHSGGVD